jgi:hypothetical protein
MWPQWTVLFFIVLELGIVMANHGKPRAEWNFWMTLLASALWFTLLYLGGFFKGMF